MSIDFAWICNYDWTYSCILKFKLAIKKPNLTRQTNEKYEKCRNINKNFIIFSTCFVAFFHTFAGTFLRKKIESSLFSVFTAPCRDVSFLSFWSYFLILIPCLFYFYPTYERNAKFALNLDLNDGSSSTKQQFLDTYFVFSFSKLIQLITFHFSNYTVFVIKIISVDNNNERGTRMMYFITLSTCYCLG